jgi:hypothetical protein
MSQLRKGDVDDQGNQNQEEVKDYISSYIHAGL